LSISRITLSFDLSRRQAVLAWELKVLGTFPASRLTKFQPKYASNRLQVQTAGGSLAGLIEQQKIVVKKFA